MKMKNTILTLLAFLSLITLCPAQPSAVPPVTLLVSDGSSSGTYKMFFDQMTTVLKEDPSFDMTFQEVESSGAVDNLDNLVNNKASFAFMHSDVLAYRAQNGTEDLSHFKTFLALFNEDVHFVTMANPKKIGGYAGWGQTDLVLNDVSSLGDHPAKYRCKVGAAGGGFITANVIKTVGQVDYDVVQYGSGSDALNALRNGQVDAVEFTGAAPLPNLDKLGNDYKLLSFSAGLQDRLRAIYKPTTITYVHMSPQPVSTVCAKCLVVTKEYKSKRMITALDKFRQDILNNLDEIKERPGNHPKWAQVDPTKHGSWPYLELPSDKNDPKQQSTDAKDNE